MSVRKVLRTTLLKEKFDPLLYVKEELYEKLAPYMRIKKYRKGEVIQNKGEPDGYARYVYKGYVAKMFPSETGRDYRVRIFGPGKVATDLASYFTNSPSQFYLRALTYTSTFELSTEAEQSLFRELPEVSQLSTRINREILLEEVLWHDVLSLPVREGLIVLKRYFPDEINHLSRKDLAYILRSSAQSVTELLSTL